MFKTPLKDEIKVPANIDYLGDLRNFVTKSGKKHGFSDSIVNAFKLSIDEAATNIIKHAYRDSEGFITMRIVVKKNSMTVILIDQGRYFDPARVKSPDLKRYVDIGKKGGLGIFIIRKLIDEVDYRHTEEGNELRLTKYKHGDFKRTGIEPTPSPLSLSLKSKYSLVAAAVLTLMIIIGYLYFYFSHGKQVVGEILTIEKSFSENIARTVLNPNEEALSTVYIYSHLNEAIDLAEHDEIYRIIIVDVKNLCHYSTDDELIYTTYKIPDNYDIVSPGIYQYRLKNKKVEIYDIINSIYGDNDLKVGDVHLQIKKDFVNKIVTSQRTEDLKLAMFILLMGYLGIAILIYIVMNPFRKLSDWIKNIGHGEVEDELDFDTGNEVGEIAKAFSEITDKFRQSQANLAEQERMQKEMQLAQDIQQTLLPTHVPEIEGYEIFSMYEAAKEVGGDYFDFVEVDKDCLGIVVADVSGKGVPGSLIMTMIRTALRTEARGVKSASEVLARLNDFVVKDMKKGMFVTIFYVIIDSKRRRLNYASAGHNPMILYRKNTNKTYYLNPKGFPVGISLTDRDLFKKSIESDTIQLAEDDILLIYTDGITEAMNGKRQLFGEERLLKAIRNLGHLRVQPFVEKLKEEIHSFTQGFEQNDDITFVAIKEKSSPEKIELDRAQKAHNLILCGKSIRESCEEAGITTYAYYNKYKKIFEEEGIDAYSIDETVSVEAKHISIEEKTKIYDIIRKHPEYGAKRISEELNTERYDLTKINESRIYDELVRSRLNTRQLREAYIARAGRKKRMKPPGTPMLTLDGRIILDKERYQYEEESFEEVETEQKEDYKTITSPSSEFEEKEKVPVIPKDIDDDFYIESLMTVPLEELLEKKRDGNGKVEKDELKEEIEEKELEEDDLFERETEEEISVEHEFSFKDIWEEETIELEEKEGSKLVDEKENDIETILEDDEISFEKLTETDELDPTSIYKDNDIDGTHNDMASINEEVKTDIDIDIKDTTSKCEDYNSLELKESKEKDFMLEQNEKISFNDLLDEIEQDVGFIDNGMIEIDENNDTSSRDDDNEGSYSEQQQENKFKKMLNEKRLILGLKYYKNSQYNKAIEEFKYIVELYSDFKEIHSILGNAYFRNEMFDQAMLEYQRVKEIDPSDVDACENIGVIYANRGEYLKAISEWEKILAVNPDRKDIRKNIEKAKDFIKKSKEQSLGNLDD